MKKLPAALLCLAPARGAALAVTAGLDEPAQVNPEERYGNDSEATDGSDLTIPVVWSGRRATDDGIRGRGGFGPRQHPPVFAE